MTGTQGPGPITRGGITFASTAQLKASAEATADGLIALGRVPAGDRATVVREAEADPPATIAKYTSAAAAAETAEHDAYMARCFPAAARRAAAGRAAASTDAHDAFMARSFPGQRRAA